MASKIRVTKKRFGIFNLACIDALVYFLVFGGHFKGVKRMDLNVFGRVNEHIQGHAKNVFAKSFVR